MTARPARLRGGAAALPLLALLSVACAPQPGRIEGRAVSGGGGAAGVAVDAYPTGERRPGTPPFASAATAADGAFSLALPAGAWWLVARGSGAAEGPRLVGEHAGNPVRLAAGAVARIGDIELRRAGGGSGPAPAGTGLRGRALLGGAPAGDAAVMVYAGTRERLAGPGYVALVRSGADGGFQVDLAPGAYRVAVRRRSGGGAAGFLRAGDAGAVAGRDPVTVLPGGYLDLGDLELSPVDGERLAAEAARGFQQPSATALEGRIVDREGKPRGGLFVYVYRDEGMIGRPEGVAQAAADGSFALSLPGGGRYWIGAREGRGGPRRPGEWSGTVAGAADGGLAVPEGRRVKGLTVVVGREW